MTNLDQIDNNINNNPITSLSSSDNDTDDDINSTYSTYKWCCCHVVSNTEEWSGVCVCVCIVYLNLP